jgi:DNA-binding SARP family transcriptional activator
MSDYNEEKNGYAAFSVKLLGGFDLLCDQHPVRLPLGDQRLIAFLALRSRASRAEAAGSLWPEVDDLRAHGCLRTGIWQIQRCCPGLLVTQGKELRFGNDVYVDTIDFEGRAHRILREPQNIPLAELMDDAILRRLLPGWYDEWLLHAQEQFKQLQLHVLEVVGEELLSREKPGPALWAAFDAINAEPLRESAHRLVIRIHIAEGNASEAIRHYRQYSSLLHDELGVRPTKQLQELVGGIHFNIPVVAHRDDLN